MHVDMDSFYPAVEIRSNPALIGKPVIVGADPKEGKGRGVVTSCSYDARKFGVHSGQPISQAYRLCPHAVFVQPNFELYGEVSERIMETLRSFSDKFQQLGIDEAYLDVTGQAANYDGAVDLAKRMKTMIREQEGLTCSIGIAPNKSTAKIASDYQKPDGLTVVESERVKEFLAPLPVSKIPGVGEKTEKILRELGILTIGDLSRIPGKDVVKMFGKNGVWLWAIANGIEETPVEERPERKSISVEQTFAKDVDDRKIVKEALNALCEEVHGRLKSERLVYKTVGIKVRFKGFVTFTRERSFTSFSDDLSLIRSCVMSLFAEFERDRKRVRLVGVRLSNLKAAEDGQERLVSFA